ncbi:DNA repair protein RecN [mine drainage metagenome]|uniref:DNA repair protein RecN n=1 Tax=mine drainage metagenome TaxID=410659 RepID=A0A1J5S0I1_9ZZZZ
MLQTLAIRNLALLEEVSLEFDEGFTVVTGETGAGKSVLLGALSLLAGERADKAVIRQGAAACEVEASLFFRDSRRIDAVLAQLELPACEDGVLILRRVLPREKAPKITVNGALATLAALQSLGEHWIDFHGPSEPRRLLKENCQLELLDLYAKDGDALAAYGEAHGAWRSLLSERERLTRETRLDPDQLSFLQKQLAALDGLDLSTEAIEALERDHARMSRAQELIGIASELAAGLTGEEGLSGRLAALLREARHLEAIDPSTKPLADRLGSSVVELTDLGAEFESLSQSLNFEPEQAEALEATMNAWLDARRRHGPDLESVRLAREQLREKISMQGDLEGACARLDERIRKAETKVREAARVLRTQREKAARELAKVASKSIVELGFRKAEFAVRLTSLAEFGPTGDCRCEFLFSPNVGEAPLPLSRIASSGELARVMLALKTVLADIDEVPLLVFDEVDANVGGEIGRIVGEKMAGIARRHQVLCVTHLPQVAALGTAHLLVEKDQSRERAVIGISALHGRRKERIAELARMLGDRTAKSALSHATELLGER